MTTVLIVDARSEMRQALRELLTRGGLAVTGEAANIADAVCQVRRLTPDLALVDLSLPGINGLTGIQHLRSARPKLQIILITMYYSRALHAAAIAAGAQDCMPKDELDLAWVQSWAPTR